MDFMGLQGVFQVCAIHVKRCVSNVLHMVCSIVVHEEMPYIPQRASANTMDRPRLQQ